MSCSSGSDKTGTGGSPGSTGGNAGSGKAGASGGMGGMGGMGGGMAVVPQTCVPFADMNQPIQMLSQTGCVNATNPTQLAPSVTYYEVNSPLWSDGADKMRGMALPSGGKIHVVNCTANPSECPGPRDYADDGKWKFPAGTVMVKSFMFDGKFLETRLLMHPDATTWEGFTYKWDEAQTDATLESQDRDEENFDTGKQTVDWHFPSRMDCVTCHIPDKGYGVLGGETAQFNRVVNGANQLDKLQAMGAFDAPIPTPYKAALIEPTTSQLGSPPASASLEQKATTYLHANCGFCHRPDDNIDCTTDPCLDLRFGIPLADRNICNVAPVKGNFSLTNPVIMAPGHPELSVMSIRMKQPADDSTGHHGRMPLIASYVVDQQATDLIDAWITSVTSCPTN
ncbi:MAG TPA: hypothetical protein VMT03_06395 [Polyangia bacterium]|nr:hypothetical protein [Polyangia bacterium]